MQKLLVTRPRTVTGGAGGAENQIGTPSDTSWWASSFGGFINWLNSITTSPPLKSNR
jgi:hypothetical protein